MVGWIDVEVKFREPGCQQNKSYRYTHDWFSHKQLAQDHVETLIMNPICEVVLC